MLPPRNRIVVKLLRNCIRRHQLLTTRLTTRNVVTCADYSLVDSLHRCSAPAMGQTVSHNAPEMEPAMSCDSPLEHTRAEHSETGSYKKSDILHRFDWIADHGPCIPVCGKNITVLNDPHDFYNCLKDLADGATQRIVLASLYLGTGRMERDLVDCLHRASARSASLRVNILLDYMRGSRETQDGASSRSMLLELVRQHRERANVALYHTPDLRGMVRHLLPQRYNEAFGVSHFKVYLFDDTLVMSGANLSESYFTNRQDRYIKVTDSRPLGDYFERLVSAVTSLSFHLQPSGDVEMIDNKHGHPFSGDAESSRIYREEMRRRVEKVIRPGTGSYRNDTGSYRNDTGSYRNDTGSDRPNCPTSTLNHCTRPHTNGTASKPPSLSSEGWIGDMPRPSLSSPDILADSATMNSTVTTAIPLSSSPLLGKYTHFNSETSKTLSDDMGALSSSPCLQTDTTTATVLQSSKDIITTSESSVDLTAATALPSCEDLITLSSLKDADTLIFPLVQMGPFDITQDDMVTQILMRAAEEDTRIYLASGYFNLTTKYMRCIINECRAVFNILTAAPQANGFYGAQGPSGAIPDVYTYIAHQFYDAVSLANQRQRISLHEYSRPGWTVHTKGLWYYVNGETLPYLTAIGSPNFGYRSVYRDLECQMLILSRDESLRRQLHEERQRLYEGSELVSDRTFSQPQRRVPTWVAMVTPFIKNFF